MLASRSCSQWTLKSVEQALPGTHLVALELRQRVGGAALCLEADMGARGRSYTCRCVVCHAASCSMCIMQHASAEDLTVRQWQSKGKVHTTGQTNVRATYLRPLP